MFLPVYLPFKIAPKKQSRSDMVVHAFKLSSHGRVRQISKFEASLPCTGNLGQPGLYSETKSQKQTSHTQKNNKIVQKNNNTTTKLGNQSLAQWYDGTQSPGRRTSIQEE